MEDKASETVPTLADLQQVRAYDQVSHGKLMATVAALQETGLLPLPDRQVLFSAWPDLHVLRVEGIGSRGYSQVPAGLGAYAQARAIRQRLQAELRQG